MEPPDTANLEGHLLSEDGGVDGDDGAGVGRVGRGVQYDLARRVDDARASWRAVPREPANTVVCLRLGDGSARPGDGDGARSQDRRPKQGALADASSRGLPDVDDAVRLGTVLDGGREWEKAGRIADAAVGVVRDGPRRVPAERKAADEFGAKTVDLAYGVLKKAWHPDADKAPSLILWNGSFGYDIATIGIKKMYQNLKESVAKLCKHEEEKGGELYIGFEPKPNEGHPAMLIPTVASALVFWNKLEEKFGVSRDKKGVNKEFGHSEMIGLDHVYDSVEELDNNAMVHMHLNSQ